MSGPDLYSGVFWLADQPASRVFGSLSLSGGTPVLDLVDDLVARFERVEVGQPGGDDTRVTEWHPRTTGPDVERFTIHGEIINPRRDVTLLECFTRGYGDGQMLQGSCALLGGHASEDIKVSAARFGLPYLDEWAQMAKIEASESDDLIKFTSEPTEPLTVDLPEPLLCRLELSVETSKPQITWMNAQIEVQASMTFKELPDVPLAAVWWGLAAVSEIYTLAIDFEARPTRLEVLHSTQGRWLEVIDARMVAAPEDHSVDRLRRILLFRQHGDMQAIAHWVGGYERLRPIPAVVVRSMRSEGSVLEVQLFELASAAEGFDRRRTEAKRTTLFDPAALKAARRAARQAAGENEHLANAVLSAFTHLGDMSYDERLSRLLDSVRPAMPEVAEWACAEWKARVKEARNGLAHRLPSYPGMPWTERWREELAILKSLRWVMTALLLLEAGIDPTALAGRLRQHEPYKVFMEQSRDWLPEVFSAVSSASS